MELLSTLGFDGSYFILGLLAGELLLFILLLVMIVKHSNLRKKYNEFMKGADGSSLESTILARFGEVDKLKMDYKTVRSNIDSMKENLLIAFQKSAIVKYDAFKEMGGKLSFSLCLLDDNNDGIILTSMHSSREGCYTYVKEIIKGESFVILSEEEKEALTEAKNKKNYMG